jgi:peptide/nickel transport system permease protein
VKRYVFRRLLVAIPSLLIASLIVFSLPRLLPGDVVQLMLEEKAYGKDVDDLRHKLGLDRPIYIQYFAWLGQIGRGDLRESLWTWRPVLEELTRRLPISLELGVLALAFAIVIAVPIGVLAAIRQDTCGLRDAEPWPSSGSRCPASGSPPSACSCPRSGGDGARPSSSPHSPSTLGPLRPVPAARVHPRHRSAAAIMRLTRGTLLEVLRQTTCAPPGPRASASAWWWSSTARRTR